MINTRSRCSCVLSLNDCRQYRRKKCSQTKQSELMSVCWRLLWNLCWGKAVLRFSVSIQVFCVLLASVRTKYTPSIWIFRDILCASVCVFFFFGVLVVGHVQAQQIRKKSQRSLRQLQYRIEVIFVIKNNNLKKKRAHIFYGASASAITIASASASASSISSFVL